MRKQLSDLTKKHASQTQQVQELQDKYNSVVKDKDGVEKELLSAVASLEEEKNAKTHSTEAKTELEARNKALSAEIARLKERESRLQAEHQK